MVLIDSIIAFRIIASNESYVALEKLGVFIDSKSDLALTNWTVSSEHPSYVNKNNLKKLRLFIWY